MKTDTARKIVQFIKENGRVTAKQLYDYFEISPQAIFKQLKKLVKNNELTKQGKSPKVFYSIFNEIVSTVEYKFSDEIEAIINHNFYTVTPSGEEKLGLEGFVYFCEKRKLNIKKSVDDYVSILKKNELYRENGLINGLLKIESTFENVFLDALYYQDFYAIERFGKTKLGQILLYAKQSQDKKQIQRLIGIIRPSIQYLIKRYSINVVGFVPPTVKRHVQLMSEIKNRLNLKLPSLSIVKVKTVVVVPQKTLSKLQDRIENATHTIIVDELKTFRNILLIDDAVGSGSTLNQTARQLKDKKIVTGKIIGFAITGSFKGFDVISEV